MPEYRRRLFRVHVPGSLGHSIADASWMIGDSAPGKLQNARSAGGKKWITKTFFVEHHLSNVSVGVSFCAIRRLSLLAVWLLPRVRRIPQREPPVPYPSRTGTSSVEATGCAWSRCKMTLYAATPTLILRPSRWPGENRTTPSWRCPLLVGGLPTSESHISHACLHLLQWVSSSLLTWTSWRRLASLRTSFCLKSGSGRSTRV